MNILFITKHNPFGFGGGALASLSFIQLFSQISKGNFDLIMAKECYDKKKAYSIIRNAYLVPPRSKFQVLFEYPRGIFHRYNQFVKRSRQILNNYDYIVLDNSVISATFVKIFNKKGIKTITIHHNYEPEYYLADNKSLIKFLFLPYIKRNEKRAYKKSWLNIFLTEADKNKFNLQYGETLAKNISCFFMHKNIFDNSTEKKYEFIITCSLENFQNVKCITKFIDEYNDEIKMLKSLVIAGRNPNKDIINLVSKYKNLKLISNPNDMDSLLATSHIYICPIEDGGGIKVRCLDAISHLMPVIIHKNSIRGYEIFRNLGLFFEYDDKTSFRIAIENAHSLLSDNKYKEKYRNIINNYFTIDAAIQSLKVLCGA